MSNRVGFALAVMLLMIGAGLRMWQFSTLPAGLHAGEIVDVQVTETIRQGDIEVFYNLGGEGREGLYHALQTIITSVMGNGTLGFDLLGLWAGMLALALVYALAARLFGPMAAVAALGLLALNMWMIVLSRQVGRETLLPALVAAVLLMLARTMGAYRDLHPLIPLNTAFAALGLLLGIGFYLHPVHFFIILFSVVFILYRLTYRPRSKGQTSGYKLLPHLPVRLIVSSERMTRQTYSYLLFSVLLTAIVAMPYVISSIRLPQLSGAARVFEAYNVLQKDPFTSSINTLNGILFSGDPNPAHNLPDRPLIDLFSGLCVLFGVLIAVRGWRSPRYALPLIAGVILLPSALLASDSPNFLTVAALMPLLALFFGLGFNGLMQQLTRGRSWLTGLALIALFGFNLYWTGRDVFEHWPNLPETQVAYNSRSGQLADYLDRTADHIPTVICTAPRSEAGDGNGTQTFNSSDLLLLMMNRKDISLRFADCGTGMIFVNGGMKQQIIMPEPDTLTSMQPALRNWMNRGTVLTDTDLPRDSVVVLRANDALADVVGKFTTTAPAAYAPESPGGTSVAAPPVRFGGNIAFLGYEKLDETSYTPGSVVRVVTYWRVDGKVPSDLRLFTHILSDPAAIVAQNDTISVNVSQLQNRDVFIQITFVPLPYSIPAGIYDVSIGAFRDGDKGRLAVMDGDQERGTRLFIGQINVIR